MSNADLHTSHNAQHTTHTAQGVLHVVIQRRADPRCKGQVILLQAHPPMTYHQVQVALHTHAHTHIRTYARARTRTHAHTHICMHVHTHIHTHTHTHTHIRIHTHIHTHAHTDARTHSALTCTCPCVWQGCCSSGSLSSGRGPGCARYHRPWLRHLCHRQAPARGCETHPAGPLQEPVAHTNWQSLYVSDAGTAFQHG